MLVAVVGATFGQRRRSGVGRSRETWSTTEVVDLPFKFVYLLVLGLGGPLGVSYAKKHPPPLLPDQVVRGTAS